MFIKRGDGQILSVVKTEDLTEDQKKSADELKKSVKEVKSEDPDKKGK